jgi:hypothetical protein
MKEVPHPGWDNDDPCKGCRYYKECKGKKKQCRKKVPGADRGAPPFGPSWPEVINGRPGADP